MRIIGVNIPDNKKIKISLTSIYGVGQFSAANILQAAGVNPDKLAKELDQAEVAKLQAEIDKNFRVEGVLRQTIKQNIERLKDIKSYRGLRHIKKLPAPACSNKRRFFAKEVKRRTISAVASFEPRSITRIS